MIVLIIADVWKTTPFLGIILLSGLQSIPKDLYEAHAIDGARPWQVITGGGPAGATETVSIYIYATVMRYLDFGYGAALVVITFLLLIIIVVIIGVLLLYFKKDR